MTPIEQAIELFTEYLPPRTVLTIEETNVRFMPKYIYRLQYTSKKSGRTMCMVCKGDSLPKTTDETFHFYRRQLTLTPTEVAREFSRIYYLERRAKQEAFLSGQMGNIRVSGKSDIQGEQDGASIEDSILVETLGNFRSFHDPERKDGER